jgi:hypothetical protein
MPALSEYSNVHNTAFNILVKKGYRIWIEKDDIGDLCWAEKDGWDFFANTPCALLGLIAIYEFKNPEKYHEYWWKDDTLELAEKMIQVAPDYVSVIEKEL